MTKTIGSANQAIQTSSGAVVPYEYSIRYMLMTTPRIEKNISTVMPTQASGMLALS